ncbi:hypothetical protein Tco_1399114 [Tanacetum coccineum]
MKGSCKSLVELEYFLEEVCKATTDQLDWNNPEGQQYPHDLCKPLQLIPNSRGRRVIPFDHLINNDLAESAHDVYSRHRILAVIKLKIVEWHNYKQTSPSRHRRHAAPYCFIYQNKDKKNRLMHIDELYKFSDDAHNDVQSALDDILKRIRMKYLPQTVWRNVNKEKAGAMV